VRPPSIPRHLAGINHDEFGPIDRRVDIYHVGLLFLQLLIGPRTFSREEIVQGLPRELALSLDPPYSFALEKALRRRTFYRTASAMELWRDLNTPRP
jgi:hypothetical protein